MKDLLHAAYLPFWRSLEDGPLRNLAADLRKTTSHRIDSVKHGDLARWQAALAELPAAPCIVQLDTEAVTATASTVTDEVTLARYRHALQALQPWRKGPFDLAGIHIDSEWRSQLKWQRCLDAGIDLKAACVLDVGAGNGYYALRMLGAGAQCVLGVDPTLLYCLQSIAVQRFTQCHAAAVLPLALQDLPPARPYFDYVFSMGVLYHQRDHLAHLHALAAWLKPGGTLVLETLVLADHDEALLEAPERYARMRNVFAVPRSDTLAGWIRAAGLTRVQRAHIGPTSSAEQRATDWMRFDSLAAALNPNDLSRTIEGWLAPTRGLFTASRAWS